MLAIVFLFSLAIVAILACLVIIIGAVKVIGLVIGLIIPHRRQTPAATTPPAVTAAPVPPAPAPAAAPAPIVGATRVAVPFKTPLPAPYKRREGGRLFTKEERKAMGL